jgi:queuine tRNA-ribosyltransferase
MRYNILMIKEFRTLGGKKYALPVFFPDATQAVVKSLDTVDIVNTKTPGVLVNTYHLYRELGKDLIKKFDGVGKFMNYDGAIISDSGGFQVMSLIKAKTGNGKVDDVGITFYPSKKKKILLTPEKSIDYQIKLKTDLIVVLDDFTPPNATREDAQATVERTLKWAKRCREYYNKFYTLGEGPYLIGVVQGGKYPDLRKYCTEKLVEIGFDGLGYGGWPIDSEGEFDYQTARIIADNTPPDYLLYGLGIGKPNEVVKLFEMGYQIFDCVLPTRDARHERLYIYDAKTVDEINLNGDKFYSYYVPSKQKYYFLNEPVSSACDCLLCKNYTKAYLAHLFRINDISAMRLASIHNMRFYSILMERLRNTEH